MAVAAATYAIGSGVDSITLARAGAADASGTLMLFVVSCISAYLRPVEHHKSGR